MEVWTDERLWIEELVNDPALPGASLARARLPAGTTAQLHALAGTTEVYLIERGAGRVEVSGRWRRVAPGDRVLIPAGAPQRAQAGPDGDLGFLCLCTPRFVPDCYEPLED